MDLFRLAGPLLRALDPETAHGLTLRALRAGLGPVAGAPDDPILSQEIWGKRFANPIGIAAGFDKNAEAVGPLFRLGFGFVEVGTVTPRAQPGNPRPRLFRLAEDQAVINRLGFNNAGAEAAARRLAAWRSAGLPGPLGVNLGKNRDSAEAAADYAAGARRLGRYADYLVINVSSPNTPGLRALQGSGELESLIDRVREALEDDSAPVRVPLCVKVAPDLTTDDLDAIAAVALDRGIDGLIATNTTIARPAGLRSPYRTEAGGLSGRPLFDPSTAILAALRARIGGAIPLIAVGGVASGTDAYAKIRAGACLVQLYTALIYQGPRLIAAIQRDLAAALRRDGFASVTAAVGRGAGETGSTSA